MSVFRSLLCACLVLCSVATSFAQEPPKPTPEHKVLHKDSGVWDAAIKMWMPGQDEAMEAKGVESNRMLGGMWSVSTFKGEFFGQPFEGRGQFGYDAHKKKYVGTWIDSMEPHISQMSGDWDAKTNTLTLMSTGVDPETGKPRNGKNITVYKDKNTRLMTMYMETKPGEYVKSMEITYTRRAKKAKKAGAKKPAAKKGAKKAAPKKDAPKKDAPKKDAPKKDSVKN